MRLWQTWLFIVGLNVVFFGVIVTLLVAVRALAQAVIP